MGETVKVPVSNGIWTDVTGGIKQGMITNNSYHRMRYRESILQPIDSDTFGHELHPQENRYFELEGNSRIWAYGFRNDAKIALTAGVSAGISVNANVEFKNGPNIDPSGRLRVSEPFGILENKNVLSRNRNQWEEPITGVILEYNTLIGGPFTPGEEIRGTGELLPIGTINTDNGVDTMNIDVFHNDFLVGMTITGQTSLATAVLTSTDTGSDIQHEFNEASVKLTVGTGATDVAIRQTHRHAGYVPFKSQYPTLTFRFAPAKTNVIQRVGLYNEGNGVFLELTETDLAFVIRSSTSGTPVDTRYPQSEWDIDRFDGGASNGPNPSGITFDPTKVQLVAMLFVWQGVGAIFLGFDLNNEIQYAHHIVTANVDTVPFFRTPSLPLRYEIRNTGVTASPTTFTEICSTVSSEGGYTLPGLEFSASRGIVAKSVGAGALEPVLAIRLRNNFPDGNPNERIAKFLRAVISTETNSAYIEIRHIHEAVDITATWNDVGGGSGVEYSTDISAITGRPFHIIENDYVPVAAGNKLFSRDISGEFINLHAFISQNFNSTNSELFVIYAQSFTGNSTVRAGITWIEFE